MGLADRLGHHALDAQILDIQGGQNAVVENGTDADHHGVHLGEFQLFHGLGIGGVGDHRPTDPVANLLNQLGFDVDAQDLVALLKQGGGQIKSEITESDDGKLLFHAIIQS